MVGRISYRSGHRVDDRCGAAPNLKKSGCRKPAGDGRLSDAAANRRSRKPNGPNRNQINARSRKEGGWLIGPGRLDRKNVVRNETAE